MKATVTFIESGRQAPTQETVPRTQGREDTRIQQPPAVPRGGEVPAQKEVPTQEREDVAVEEPPATGPSTGGPDPVLLISLLAAVAAVVGVLGWAVKRRSS